MCVCARVCARVCVLHAARTGGGALEFVGGDDDGGVEGGARLLVLLQPVELDPEHEPRARPADRRTDG